MKPGHEAKREPDGQRRAHVEHEHGDEAVERRLLAEAGRKLLAEAQGHEVADAPGWPAEATCQAMPFQAPNTVAPTSTTSMQMS